MTETKYDAARAAYVAGRDGADPAPLDADLLRGLEHDAIQRGQLSHDAGGPGPTVEVLSEHLRTPEARAAFESLHSGQLEADADDLAAMDAAEQQLAAARDSDVDTSAIRPPAFDASDVSIEVARNKRRAADLGEVAHMAPELAEAIQRAQRLRVELAGFASLAPEIKRNPTVQAATLPRIREYSALRYRIARAMVARDLARELGVTESEVEAFGASSGGARALRPAVDALRAAVDLLSRAVEG